MEDTEHGAALALDPAATVICRCEEILREEVVAAINAGARQVDDVKRRTRAGMGLCQGIYCAPTTAALIGQTTGTMVDLLAPMSARPPVRPIPLEALANLESHDTDRGNSDGMDEG